LKETRLTVYLSVAYLPHVPSGGLGDVNVGKNRDVVRAEAEAG